MEGFNIVGTIGFEFANITFTDTFCKWLVECSVVHLRISDLQVNVVFPDQHDKNFRLFCQAFAPIYPENEVMTEAEMNHILAAGVNHMQDKLLGGH